jgi:signal transduction histidine kinase
LLIAGASVTYFAVRKELYAEFNRSLIQQAVLLASMIERDGDEIKVEWLEHGSIPPGHKPGTDYFSLWVDGSNGVLAASAELGAVRLPRMGGTFAQPELREVMLPGGQSGRSVGINFDLDQPLRDEESAEKATESKAGNSAQASPAAATTGQLVLARVDNVAPILQALRWPLLATWVSCMLMGAALIWMVVLRGLRPLEVLKTQIGALKEAATGQRILVSDQPAELEPVTRELNRLLERIEQALVRERTLTSNVAHELRTPIAGLLSTLEVTLNRLRSPEEYREATGECFEIAKRMNWLVNNLLSITRVEAGDVPLQTHELLVESALAEWWQPFEARAGERRLRVDWKVEPGTRLTTDPEFLRVVLTNLFDNAVSYAPEGGAIRVEALPNGSISVANEAVAVNPELLKHAFDPFWRDAATEGDSVAHAGLGLNLCRKIMDLLGGRIRAQIEESGQLFVVRLNVP